MLHRITVHTVTDEGSHVTVTGHSHQCDGELESFTFPTKGPDADVGLAERASRLARGVEATIDADRVAGSWNLARGLSGSG